MSRNTWTPTQEQLILLRRNALSITLRVVKTVVDTVLEYAMAARSLLRGG